MNIKLVKKKKKQNKKSKEETKPEYEKMWQFDRRHPNGASDYVDSIIREFREMERHLIFKYQMTQELLDAVQERKDFRTYLRSELKELKKQRGDRPFSVQEQAGNAEGPFVPEVFIPSDTPNLFQKVFDAVADSKGAGITEANLNKMELEIINMFETAKEFVFWLMRLLMSVRNESRKAKIHSVELKDLINLIMAHTQQDKIESPANSSFSRDSPTQPQSVTLIIETSKNKLDLEQVGQSMNRLPVFSKLFPDYRNFLASMILRDNLIKVFLSPSIIDQCIQETDRSSDSKTVHLELFSTLRSRTKSKISTEMNSNFLIIKDVLCRLSKRIQDMIALKASPGEPDFPRLKLQMIYEKFTPELRRAMKSKVDSFKERAQSALKLDDSRAVEDSPQRHKKSEKFFKEVSCSHVGKADTKGSLRLRRNSELDSLKESDSYAGLLQKHESPDCENPSEVKRRDGNPAQHEPPVQHAARPDTPARACPRRSCRPGRRQRARNQDFGCAESERDAAETVHHPHEPQRERNAQDSVEHATPRPHLLE